MFPGRPGTNHAGLGLTRRCSGLATLAAELHFVRRQRAHAALPIKGPSRAFRSGQHSAPYLSESSLTAIAITDWPTLLAEVRRRPGMYLGEPSLKALQHELDGIQWAEQLYAVPPERRLQGFSFAAFERWFQEHLNPRRLSLNSFHMARCLTASDEAAFHLWFSWYDSFRSEQAPPDLPPDPGTLPRLPSNRHG